MLRTLLATMALVASSALAQTAQNAIITITTSDGGAGIGLTNQTVTVPLNRPFTNSSALDAVSYLYLTGATGAPFDSITCQAYQDADGTEQGGNPFNSTTPAYLDTNTVPVGSIICTTTYLAMAPPGGDFSTSILATGTSSGGSNLSTTATSRRTSALTTDAGPMTSVFVTTMSPTGGEPATQSTVTSVFVPSEPTASANPTDDGGDQGGQQGGSATTSASAGLSSPNAGTGRELDAEIYAGLAIAWMGVAYVM